MSQAADVEGICLAALEHPENERAAFLANACRGDDALRREVESLLAHASPAEEFLAQPAVHGSDALAGLSGLSIGQSLGPYHILDKLGVGGMGEVYRARDTQLGREVAIKILPVVFAVDPERLARFEREAHVLASLNHPRIAAIYGIETAPAEAGHRVRALVMELVEGMTIAERIEGGPLPVAEALAIARQIADALDAAHEQGFLHRDLKPANIKIRPDGVVKLLDFGLARAAIADGATTNLTQSPTVTSGGTRAGTVLGTPAYMSPEQARGKAVDRRTDIWAFGCVLYEMLTGRRAFEGKDAAETLAAVIKEEPRLDDIDVTLRPLLQHCLEKDPKKRLRHLGDIGLLFDQQQARAVYTPRIAWLWPSAAALLLAVASVLALTHFREIPLVRQSSRFQIPAPGSTAAQMLALSPDGRYLAFVASVDGTNKLWVRAMDALEARPLDGTDDATYPFWSPDGQELGFFSQRKLRKIAVAGGPIKTLCEASGGRGGSWNRDGVIVFSPATFSPIFRVSAVGGEPSPVTKAGGSDGHRFPAFLPDGIHFFYNGESGLFVGSLDGTEPVRILPDATNGLYAPPAVPGGDGFLIFRRNNTLMAQPFDALGLKTTAEMFPVAEQVSLGSASIGFGAFSVAANGTLVYQGGGNVARRELVWVNRSGTRLAAATERGSVDTYFSLSPDEKILAVAITEGDGDIEGDADIWLQDLERGLRTRFTFGAGPNRGPIWSPDGNVVAFSVRAPGQYSSTIYLQSMAGRPKEELHSRTSVGGLATDWSSDGTLIVFQQIAEQADGRADLWLLPLAGDRTPIPYLQTPFDEEQGRFSPSSVDGFRWMAYQSNESGQNEVYIQAIPASGARYQVSTMGGTFPRWRQDGKELFYISTGGKLMAASVRLGTSLQIGKPRELFTNAGMTSYVPAGDGQRFLVNTVAEPLAPTPITVVLNWMAGSKR